MQTRLDKFGRIVLPKDVRDDYALEPGDALMVRETSEGILLTPAHQAGEGSPLRVIGGVLVYDGQAETDLAGAVSLDREERMRVLSKGARVRSKAKQRR